MRKLIDMPKDILQDLQILAVKEGKDLKNYIQDMLIVHVKKSVGKNSIVYNV